MKTIRQGVFETNSSSSHSLSIREGKWGQLELKPNDEEYIEVEPGQFGWEIKWYDDQLSKLRYLLTMVFMTEIDWEDRLKEDWIEKLEQTEGFRVLNTFVHRNSGYYLQVIGTNGDEYYIDHQSCGYESLLDFLCSYNTTIEEVILGNATIKTDNDNH